MQQRIKELAAQAGFYKEFDNKLWPYPMSAEQAEIAYNKLANQIVLECISVLNNAIDTSEPASTYVDKLKQHFEINT